LIIRAYSKITKTASERLATIEQIKGKVKGAR